MSGSSPLGKRLSICAKKRDKSKSNETEEYWPFGPEGQWAAQLWARRLLLPLFQQNSQQNLPPAEEEGKWTNKRYKNTEETTYHTVCCDICVFTTSFWRCANGFQSWWVWPFRSAVTWAVTLSSNCLKGHLSQHNQPTWAVLSTTDELSVTCRFNSVVRASESCESPSFASDESGNTVESASESCLRRNESDLHGTSRFVVESSDSDLDWNNNYIVRHRYGIMTPTYWFDPGMNLWGIL